MFLKNERMGMDIFNLTSWKQATEGYMDQQHRDCSMARLRMEISVVGPVLKLLRK